MTTLEEKIAMRQRAIEGRPFGPGSTTEHEGKTMTGAQAVIASLCHCVMCCWHKPWNRLTRVKSSSQAW